MATMVLQAAGAVVGGALLGPVGAALGSAAGALVGYAVDRAIIDSTRQDVGPRLSGARPFVAEEGAPIPRLYGTSRMGGLLIWATRFEEEARTERQGAKGGPRRTTYHYYANVAFALCEGPVAGVRRIWADGRELDLTRCEYRVFNGDEVQAADPLMEARQGAGNTPAYRGTAYVVFQRFPIDDYGNRIPQFQFEVLRPVATLNPRVRAVALLPGSTEYGLSPGVVTREVSPGETVAENRHVLHASSDLRASLDELQALCPNLTRIALVVTWFGDDLRAGSCKIRPKVTRSDGTGLSQAWQVSGIARGEATLVTSHGGTAAYGGTPSDRSILDAIAEIKARGLEVTLYPFVMMDIAEGNALPNPCKGAPGTPAYPWRGRITCYPAPQVERTADKTAAARTQVQAFCGTATSASFAVATDTMAFTGAADDFGYRRLVLHYAWLAARAGGVDAFLLGSEMRGLTTLRDDEGAFPFVEQLCDLAAQVRAIVGAGCAISYGADWSEYFGYRPDDGTGDVLYHLDPLWAHPDIDAVGIDNYMPIADWRDGDELGRSPDGASGPYDPAALRAGVASGEGFDWYYASDGDRAARVRMPIRDTAYGKDWTFRYKDILSWWSNEHYDRHAGVEAPSPSAWVPGSKPIWLTELGCPAVDKGPNEPNVFPDGKSSESGAPRFSSGGRSDQALLSTARAHLDHWDGAAPDFDPSANPVSPVYGGRMVDPGRIYFWAWDARPFPAFPNRSDVWGDGSNWLRGHWLNGRVEGAPVADIAAAIMRDHGIKKFDASGIEGTLTGYELSDPSSARSALEPLVDLLGLSVSERDGTMVFTAERASSAEPLLLDEIVLPHGNEPALTRIRNAATELPAEAVLGFRDPMRDFQAATVRSFNDEAGTGGVHFISFPGVVDTAQAEALLDDWVRRKSAAREQVRFGLDHSRAEVTPGTMVRLPEGEASGTFLVSDCESGEVRALAARRLASGQPATWRGRLEAPRPVRTTRSGPPLVHFIDLPMLPGANQPQQQLRVALRANPWVPHAIYASPADDGFVQRAICASEATVGALVQAMGPGFEGRFDRAGVVIVDLLSGELSSVPDIHLLAGANVAAVLSGSGEWEVLQFGTAEEVSSGRWRLSRLLRGQGGTLPAMQAGAPEGAAFVLLNAAVVSAGISEAEIGLPLNWRIGPLGYDFAGPTFASATVAGGMRARRPLAPAHVRVTRRPGGDCEVTWIRRGRLDADRGLAGDVPLSEEFERYELQVAGGGEIRRAVTVESPSWIYPASLQAEDFPEPGLGTISVAQVSQSVGAGDPTNVEIEVG